MTDPEATKYRLFGTLFTEYLQVLGVFETDPMLESEDKPWPLFIFVFSTFIIQIVFLNILIAVVLDAFDLVMQQRKIQMTIERIQIVE